MKQKENASIQTIEDFGNQWIRYPENRGYYSSTELFKDYCGPLITSDEIKGKKILEIGSGTGRIVNMLLSLGAKHVFAVEPSQAFEILVENTKKDSDRVSYYHVSGEKTPDMEIDLAISFGVLHHIPDPKPVVDRVYELLPEGGKFIVWVYGHEGNEKYLNIFQPLRNVTQKMPDFMLHWLAGFLNVAAAVYMKLCTLVNLPLKEYVLQIFEKLDWKSRQMVIFDQLNPVYAKYYRKDEAIDLLKASGFGNLTLFHRHNYSWTVLGEKVFHSRITN